MFFDLGTYFNDLNKHIQILFCRVRYQSILFVKISFKKKKVRVHNNN